VNDQWVGPLKTGSLLTIGPLRMKVQLSDMAKDLELDESGMRQLSKRPLADEEEDEGKWRSKVWQKTDDDRRIARRKQHDLYKDRADERRKRSGNESGAAIDHLVNKFEKIVEAEKEAAEAEEARVDAPTQADHREANMNTDGSFVGFGNMERAGIGFAAEVGAELIPNVLDPKSLSTQESSRLKTQMRFQQAEGRGR